MIPEGGRDLTTYLTNLLKPAKTEQQNNAFCFLTTENSGKIEDHNPIQTRNLMEVHDVREKEKLNPKRIVESRMKFLQRFEWTDTLFTETEKQAIQFRFASRTFAYKRLAQELSRSVSAVSSSMHEYLKPNVKVDQCAQYVDDIGIASNTATDLTWNIRAVFNCFRQAGNKLTIEKCHFGFRQVQFLGRPI